MKISLALGGGAGLGWAHIGVIQALSGAGIAIAGIAGTSIGAIVAAAAAADKLEELEQIVAEGARDPDDLLLPIETALDQIPAVDLTGEEAQRLRHGQGVLLLRRGDLARLEELRQDEGDGGTALATERGRPVALVRLEGAELKPVRVLHV